ncbi:uncharacterized protein LOC6732625 [Drosophila simulans]|uniref:Cilia- and flagella-associated protein 91 n=1 Tax=Drosophila simulans TaxID=7240 RepID=A0A0J9R4S7_DROSI|nr:uncharacterized protein LOC6732625 [Drosophila simulans]KMY90729.1 uncharacterized protein Dsimw501_GD21859 [Drosophila simulans]
MPSAKEKRLRRERILQFIRENRELMPISSTTVLKPPTVKKEDTLKQKKRVTFNHGKQRSVGESTRNKDSEQNIGQGLTSCLITRSSDTRLASGANNPTENTAEKLHRTDSKCHLKSSCTKCQDSRLSAGTNNPAERDVGKLPRTDSECKFNEPGIFFLQKPHTDFSTQEVKLNAKPLRKELKNKCDFFPKYVDNRPFKDEATQTLYRESSAQTLAFLPEILNNDKSESLELYTLAKLLPGDKPPGLHEVEFLERARRRWKFSKALEDNFKHLLCEARELSIKTQYKEVLEAFEWEQWIQREEDIQQCQMMRLEIVIKMFDKREKAMHNASKARIEKSVQQIEKRRQDGLRKNEIEYQRGMRRNNIQLAKTARKWEKQSPMQALGSPCSEFYGPLIRHGVDPARRCFESNTGRKAFDMRIDELEKRVNMRNVQCPFSKLKEWSKPKEYDREYERNFCNDGNLQRLYESLKTLRTQADMPKEPPQCLKTRLRIEHRTSSSSSDSYRNYNWQARKSRYVDLSEGLRSTKTIKKMAPPRAEKVVRGSVIRRECLETLICSYEGSYVGTIMQFLADEMQRLKEQRKLHFFCILAQKERWRREAAEAGLRQKENCMRMLYEEMFQFTNSVHSEIAEKYADTILTTDVGNMVEEETAETITELAKQIDADIERWLESFKLIQNPLNFTPLRLMLQDMVSPDMGATLRRYETSLIVQYIVEDVIFYNMWQELEPFDIASTLTSDLIDRLIDNDLFLFSSDSESESGHGASWTESHAIIRKLIRQAVPGRRWKEENERIVSETFSSLFDEVFANILFGIENPEPVRGTDLLHLCASKSFAFFAHEIPSRVPVERMESSQSESFENANILRMQFLSLIKKIKEDKITKKLERTGERVKMSANEYELFDDYIKNEVLQNAEFLNSASPEPELYSIISTVDIAEYDHNLKDLRGSSIIQRTPSAEEEAIESRDEEVRSDNFEQEKEPIDVDQEKVEEAEPEQENVSEKYAGESDDLEPIIGEEFEEEHTDVGEEVVVYSTKESQVFKFR